MGPTHESIENDFAFHPATPETGEIHDAVRERFGELAHWVLDNTPPGAARSTAIAKLREGMMWANGAVACDGN